MKTEGVVPMSGGTSDEPRRARRDKSRPMPSHPDKKSMATPYDYRTVVPVSGGEDEPSNPGDKMSMATPYDYYKPVPKSMPEPGAESVERWESRRSYKVDNSRGTEEKVKK